MVVSSSVGSRSREGRELAADGRRVVHEEVARTASRVVRVSDLSRLTARTTAGTLAEFRVAQESLIVRASALPADAAGTASGRSVAVVAIAI